MSSSQAETKAPDQSSKMQEEKQAILEERKQLDKRREELDEQMKGWRESNKVSVGELEGFKAAREEGSINWRMVKMAEDEVGESRAAKRVLDEQMEEVEGKQMLLAERIRKFEEEYKVDIETEVEEGKD